MIQGVTECKATSRFLLFLVFCVISSGYHRKTKKTTSRHFENERKAGEGRNMFSELPAHHRGKVL